MSVTKILLRHNRVGNGTLPQAEAASCCEPLLFKNKLYIRSQKAEELVNPDDYNTDAAYADAVQQYRSGHPDGSPIFIGPYEHPARTTGSQLAVNVSENTQSSTEDYIYTGPGSVSNNWRWYRALTGLVTDKNGHVITAEAGLSIQFHPGTAISIPRFNTNGTQIALAWVKSDGHGAVGNQFPLGFVMNGKGYINETGSLEDVDNGPAYTDDGYQWSIGNGDCLAVTDADWASHTDMGSSIDGNSAYNHMLVRSKLAFNTSEPNKYLCQNGTWKTPSGLNVAAAPGDTSVKGVIAGSVSIDGEPTEFTVQPANSYLGGKSGAYYYTGQGVVRPLGTTTGLQTENKYKLLYSSERTDRLNDLCPTILRWPTSQKPGTELNPQKARWVAIPVYVDYHKVDGTDRVEAVPYIMLPEDLLTDVLEYWLDRREAGPETEGTKPVGENIIAIDENPNE